MPLYREDFDQLAEEALELEGQPDEESFRVRCNNLQIIESYRFDSSRGENPPGVALKQ